ncbi:flagellar protein export ATPase FliI [Helicobacter ailurogastricus]|uniref:Flagellum-specific ATP synthase FliI n=1 Tax=Helicobacter ailurogastricus TaxID=1578720 RepID=A0A0K2Y187_9HELI|nr:flagellar protein export ATPase FliI [Helicobacter ailurogastricus]BDQ29830.1 flagellum-specific ATP synthase [Helicobacter ailurogastricus]CRF52693.1 Flagellum-specific ATP synthase FliI [Helicobacter ailurogastricus]
MSLEVLRSKLQHPRDLSPRYGVVVKILPNMVFVSGFLPSVGDVVQVQKADGSECLGMVVVVEKEQFGFTPFSFVEGCRVGDRVLFMRAGLSFPVGEGLLGRVLDPLGNPLDGLGYVRASAYAPVMVAPIKPLDRGIIDEPFGVGVKSIDGLLTCGKGQKLGIFAGSGVGKSTLMGMIVRGCEAQIKVIALIGERGREIPEFIHKNLQGNLDNTVLVVATSDDAPLMRKYGAFCAMSVAEYFKNQGHDVLFMMDSVTRFAMAQREIGLALGEPPTSKGYPPSSLTLLPQLMERAGKEQNKGSITAFFTVLVEGDDLSDPIADQSRSILDGHIVLSRELTDHGIYPPINILNSASRVSKEVSSHDHMLAARKFRKLYAMLKENEVLIRIGSYQRGFDEELDEAMDKKSAMDAFLAQEEEEIISSQESVQMLQEIVQAP